MKRAADEQEEPEEEPHSDEELTLGKHAGKRFRQVGVFPFFSFPSFSLRRREGVRPGDAGRGPGRRRTDVTAAAGGRRVWAAKGGRVRWAAEM